MTTTANVFSNNTRINNFFVENLDDKHEYDSFEEWYGEFCLLIDAYQLVSEDDKNFETMSFMGKVDVHEELKEKHASSDDESSDDESSDDESSDDDNQNASIVIQSFLRGSKVRCGNERWMLMLWKVKRFISKNGRLPSTEIQFDGSDLS